MSLFGDSDEKADLKAVKNEIMQIFDEEEKATKDKLQKTFVSTFVKCRHYLMKKKPTYEYCDFKTVLTNLHDLFAKKGYYDKYETARMLAGALAYYLNTIDYLSKTGVGGGMRATLKEENKEIVKILKDINKKVSWKFITKRIRQIAKKHEGGLPEKTKDLLADLASDFK